MNDRWYLKRANQQYGPFSWEELRQHSKDGLISTEDLVKSDQMNSWVKAEGLPGLPGPEINNKGLSPAHTTSYGVNPGFYPGPGVHSGQGPGYGPPPPRKKWGLIIGGSIAAFLIIGLILLFALPAFFQGTDDPIELSLDSVTTALGVDDQGRPLETATIFAPETEEIFVTMEASGAIDGTVLTASWFYEEEEEDGDDYLIISSTLDLPAGFSRPYFSCTLPGEWPAGSYRVDLLVDGIVIAVANFSVPAVNETETPPISDSDPQDDPLDDPLADLNRAVEEWWEEKVPGEPIINAEDIDQAFYDQELYFVYSYGYQVDEVEGDRAQVTLFIIDSEPLDFMFFERQNGQWQHVLSRPFPGVGFEVLSMLGKSKNEVIDLFGEPDLHDEWDNIGGYLDYDFYGATFFFPPESDTINMITLDRQFFDALFITVGMTIIEAEAELGPPQSKGIDQNRQAERKPAYYLSYLFDQGPHSHPGSLSLKFYAENETGEIVSIIATLPDYP